MKKSYGLHTIINNRFYFIMILIIISFIIIFLAIFKMIMFDNEKYISLLNDKTNNTFVGKKAIRGNIYDRNGKLLVGNKEIKIITYTKSNGITDIEEINIAVKLSEVLEIDYTNINEKELKEYYYIKNKNYINSIINEKIKEKYEKELISEKVYKEYIYSIINEEKLKEIDKEHEVAYIYKLMNIGYSFSPKVIKNSDVTEEDIKSINDLGINELSIDVRYERYYPYGDLFKEYLGSVGSIRKEELDEYLRKGYNLDDVVGVTYLEKEYENELKGQNEIYKMSATGVKTIIKELRNGNDIMLSIDIDLQQNIENIIYEEILKSKKEPNTKYYNKAYAIISDSNTGEILASTGVGVIFSGKEYIKNNYLSDLTNYAVTPGSIVKGASHLVGYETGAINFGYTVTDSCIKVLNTPKKCSWISLGSVDDLKALRLSSNYYQYLIAIKVGKGSYYYNGPLALDKEAFNIYRKMYNSFGLGVKTGIDLPTEAIGYKGSDTNTGNILDFPIGQYDTYTPMQLLQYIMTLANSGKRISPHYMKSIYKTGSDLKTELYSYQTKTLGLVNAKTEYINRVQQGLKEVMESGTGYGYVSLSYNPYGKTGTSQSFIDTDNDGNIDTETISSAFGAYMLYNDKNISLIVLSPHVSDTKTSYTSMVNQRITRKISDLYFEN